MAQIGEKLQANLFTQVYTSSIDSYYIYLLWNRTQGTQ